jgi:hypothetical protein
MFMQPKIVIIDFDTSSSYAMKLILGKKGFECDQFTDVGRVEPKDGLISVYTVYGGCAEVRLAEYAVAFIGKIRPIAASAETIVATWREFGICCLGSSHIQSQSLLLACVEFLVNPEPKEFERFVDLWFPAFYQKACADHNNHYSN